MDYYEEFIDNNDFVKVCIYKFTPKHFTVCFGVIFVFRKHDDSSALRLGSVFKLRHQSELVEIVPVEPVDLFLKLRLV